MKKPQLQNFFVDVCYGGDLSKVAYYLRCGANPNQPDNRHYYPFHMACQEGHLSVVKLLIRNGANLDLKDDYGKGEAALFSAVGGGHLNIVKCLILSGCNVNLKRGWPSGGTPLHTACAWGRFKEAVELVNAGAKVNALNDKKMPPIYYGVIYGHSRIAAFLIKNGALTESKSRFKNKLLAIATANKDKHTLRVLIKAT